ncbi:MAG: hypothetical protein WBI14_05290 [Anaerolineaceae bacterium]
MKRLLTVFLIVVVAVSFLTTDAKAQFATGASWVSSITYYTTSTTGGSLRVNYYDGTTVYSTTDFTLAPNAAGSINIGSTSVPTGFKGSAVISSSVPVFSTYVQFASTNSKGYSRSFYTGFTSDQAGPKFYLPTVRSNGITTSTIGVQNVESYDITATIQLIPNVGAPVPPVPVNIPPSASYIAVLDSIAGVTKPFDGAAVITATKLGDPTTPANIVASSQETQDQAYGIYSYEGKKAGSTVVYLASAMCNYLGKQTSYYAIQNVGSVDATVQVEYYSGGASEGLTPVKTIAPSAKLSINPCTDSMLVGKTGSAVVRSTNAQPLLAIGKVATSDGLVTAFTGEASGSLTVVAPYIRWAFDNNTDYRSYIAVMNVGTSAATNIQAKYYDSTGTLRATHVIASVGTPLNPNAKTNTNPSLAGALIGGSFGFTADGGANGGAVEITSDQPIVVVVRLATTPLTVPGVAVFGEDYNAIPAN